jgi:F-type H+-transporting ATPase subunit epsilon
VAQLQVALVAADREVWTGEARMVIAKTTEGDLGILPGHAPVLGVLAPGAVEIRPAEGGAAILAAVDGGFLSVADDVVSILAARAELAEEISAAGAESELRAAEQEGDDQAVRRARARVRVASGHPR